MEHNQSESSSDRRGCHRKEVSTKVVYKVVIPTDGAATTANISEGGICLVLDKELPPGTVLEVKFELPGKEPVPIETLVKIVWQKKTDKGYLTGVKFGT
jgi:hypothetical protein